jgi:hypothetical protein
MQFTTKIPIDNFSNLIDYNSKIIAFGSCFAENISDKLSYYKFTVFSNPFGIIFNPISIEKLLYRIIHNVEFTEKDIFFHNDLWHCFEVHSQLSDTNNTNFLRTLNALLKQSFIEIQNATHVQITLGTAWVYRNLNNNEVVANCHKIAKNNFDKELISVELIQKSIENSIQLIQLINPNCNFLFTISPVRHSKDGFVQNTASKARLVDAIYQICQINPETISYFPSFEIMMDELRDYRFYTDDMLHPSQVAIDYIWERFVETSISESVLKTMKEVENIQKSLQHKPFNPDTESHQKFVEQLRLKIAKVQKNYPWFKFLKNDDN